MLTTNEEMALVTYIKYSQEHSMPLTTKMIKTFVRGIVKKSGRTSTIGENGPSNKWFRGFLKRHPDLKMRKPQTIDGGRVRMANKTVMKQYFDLLHNTMEKHGLLNKPEQIFNFDETGFGKGIIAQDKVCTGNGNTFTRQTSLTTHSTAAVCVSASGQVLPTFLIYEKSFPSGAYRDGIPGNWLFATSPNGYIDTDLFQRWFENVFLVYAPKARPLILTMDNHESHLSIETIKLARENHIELLCLPPHTTHILQPLDVGLFRPIKKAVCEFSVSLGYANSSLVIGKNRLAQLLKAAIDKACSVHNIKNSFRKCGMVPFNPDAIDKTKLAPYNPVFQVPGPGGDNCGNADPVDPLCEACGQFVHGHPLVTGGLIPSDLASILVPIAEPAKKKKTRIVTKSRVITGDEIYKQLAEKEQQKKRKKPSKDNTKSPSTNSNENEENDEPLPTIKPPRKRRPKTLSKPIPPQSNHDLAAEEFTCGICQLRGFEDDEEHGILWVGCDNSECAKWYHRDCLPTLQHADVDLSILEQSEWHCHLCKEVQEKENYLSTNHSSDSVMSMICQVCMEHVMDVSDQDQLLYWATCENLDCCKSFHQACLPPRVHRCMQSNATTGVKWYCGTC
ncbi:uncharacterized protein LOC117332656 [Pecten maximus]|uniref:uncharacterized protein LOC117332656 n=1 Tax=Pecten maximus TaxID=6579 RepID=UPI0014585EB5|nr:uncharacterized protein LOC117332656 [Pecten maximus]